jgi:DNA-binding NarL/FixJ family response regulator
VIRACLVDDQTLVREGIRGLLALADDIEVVAEAGDGEQALAAIAEHDPDVVLLDLRMPRMDGIAVLEQLQRDHDQPPPVLVLTTFNDDELVLRALRAGARGYLLKDVTLEQLIAAIHRLAAGGTLIQPAITAGLLERLGPRSAGHDPIAPPPSLTPREQDVLGLVAAGFPNRDVAAALHLSEGTVKNHVSSILLKLDARDRTQAVLRAVELGLVDPGRDA